MRVKQRVGGGGEGRGGAEVWGGGERTRVWMEGKVLEGARVCRAEQGTCIH